MDALKNLECKNCGAKVEFDPRDAALHCAFCGSEFFVEIPESAEEKELKKDADTILFKVERKEAHDTFSEWIKKGLFKPSNLVTSFQQKEFEGVYIPFHRIQTDTRSTWQGRDQITIKEKTETEPAEYEYRDRSGEHSESFTDFITATKGLEQNEVDGILPFDERETKPYTRELLTGFKFEQPGLNKDAAVEKAKDRLRDKVRSICSGKVDELLSTSTDFSNIKTRLIMLPIWILVYTYEGKAYRVLINGQTGKIVGRKPFSKIKGLIALLIAGGIGYGIYMLTR